MIPIRELLNRIRWDSGFGRGDFELGYFDRVEGRVIVVPFCEVVFPHDDPQVFHLVDADGRLHRVPFHRVREVNKDHRRIWHRPRKATIETAQAAGAGRRNQRASGRDRGER